LLSLTLVLRNLIVGQLLRHLESGSYRGPGENRGSQLFRSESSGKRGVFAGYDRQAALGIDVRSRLPPLVLYILRSDFDAGDVVGRIGSYAFSRAGPGGFLSGVRMNAINLPSLRLPTQIPSFHPG
jgi:hypothetical protein